MKGYYLDFNDFKKDHNPREVITHYDIIIHDFLLELYESITLGGQNSLDPENAYGAVTITNKHGVKAKLAFGHQWLERTDRMKKILMLELGAAKLIAEGISEQFEGNLLLN